MRRKLLLIMTLFVSCFVVANAEQQTNYTETFSGVNTSEFGFHPFGWGHSIYNNMSYYKATYAKETTDAGETYLTCRQYSPGAIAYDDCLVSPEVSGRVTLDAKIVQLTTNGTAGVKFYKFTESNGTYTKGAEITPDISPELNEDGFQTFVFNNVDPATRIGIRAHNVGFKNFTAAVANVVGFEKLEIGIAINSTVPAFTTQSNKKYVALNPDGNYSVTFQVQLQNKGEVDYDLSTENYTLTLKSGEKVLATVAIKDAVPAGQTVNNYYTFELNGNESTGTETFRIYENVDGKDDSDYDTLYLIPWHSEFLLQSGKTTSSIYNVKNNATVNFGSSQGATTETYYIYNTGTAPLTFQANVSEGFTLNFPDGTEVAAGEYVSMVFGITDTPFGAHTGSINFTTNASDYEEYTLNLTGVILDPSKYYENFSAGKLPADMVSGESAWSFQQGQAANTSSYTARMILPKLTVKAGEEFLISGARTSTSTYNAPVLKVYKSTDRAEWILVKEFGTDDFSSSSTSDYRSLAVDNIEPGDWYLAIDGSYVKINQLYGYEKTDLPFDVIATGQNIPATGEVNGTYMAQLTVKNPGKALTASDYKAIMKVNGTEVATAESVDMAQSASATFTFTYVPHATGIDIPVELSLVYLSTGEEMAKSQPATLTVKEETVKNEIVVGTKTNNTTTKTLYGSTAFSWSDILYQSTKMNLDPGTKITRIAFKGTTTGTPIASNMKVWLENTDLSTLKNNWTDPEEEPTYTFETYNFTPNAEEDMFVLDLSDDPFIYEGENIRIRVKMGMSSRAQMKYYIDNSVGTAYYDYESSDRTSTTLYGADVPVMYLSIDAEPTYVTGTITDAATGSVIAGANVTVKSGDVEYYGTSDNEGNYSVTLLKAINGYSVNVSAPGYFDYTNPIDITEGDVVHDVEMQLAKGLSIPEFIIPSSGKVNNAMAITGIVRNYDTTGHDGYTVNLYVDGNKVKSVEGSQLAGNSSQFDNPEAEAEFNIAYTPNEEGQHSAYLTVEWNESLMEKAYTSSTSNFNVVPETAGGEVTVGVANGFDSNAPVNTYYAASDSESVYYASELGLEPGSKILSINYKGYYSTNSGSMDVRVWMKNISEPRSESDRFNKNDMTLVYDNPVLLTSGGSASVPVDKLNLILDEPFEYDGEDLCIVVEAIANLSTCNFEIDTRYDCYARTAWSEAGLQTASAARRSRPVIRIEFESSLKHTGMVVAKWEATPIADATVTLSSGDVRYTGTTDENGEYEIAVVQRDLPYTVTVEHYLYRTYTADNFDLFTPGYIEMLIDPMTGVEEVENGDYIKLDPTQPMYDVMGRRVSESYRGIVIQNGRKYIKN